MLYTFESYSWSPEIEKLLIKEENMHYDNMKAFLEAVRDFSQKNPDTFWKVKDEPNKLRIGLLALNDDLGESHFTVSISKLKLNEGALSEEEYSIYKKYLDAQIEAYKTEKSYLDMITHREKHFNDVLIYSHG